VGQRFLHGFTGCRVLYRLAVLHEARGRGPEPVSRLDGPLAQQDLAFVLDHAARDDARVFVVDGSATGADEARQLIAWWDSEADRLGTVGTELHEVRN
jgi:hypothetical protein